MIEKKPRRAAPTGKWKAALPWRALVAARAGRSPLSRTPAAILEEFYSGALEPVDGGPASAVDRFFAADCRARSKSIDPDARTARLLAAELNLIADEIEAGVESSLSTIASKSTEARGLYLEERRRFAQKLFHTASRSTRDEWVRMAELVDAIERLAGILRNADATHLPGDRPASLRCACQNCFLVRQVGPVLRDLRAALPAVADRVTAEMIREAISACIAPRRGAPKWEAFAPIAKVIVGVEDPDEIRKEIARLRARARHGNYET